MNSIDVKEMLEITMSHAGWIQELSIRSRTLITSFMSVPPLIPPYVDPRIYDLHLNSGLIIFVEVGFHVAEIQVITVRALLNPVMDLAGNGVKTIRVTALHPGFEATLDEQVAMYQLVQERRE